jgi:hypothetical protein
MLFRRAASISRDRLSSLGSQALRPSPSIQPLPGAYPTIRAVLALATCWRAPTALECAAPSVPPKRKAVTRIYAGTVRCLRDPGSGRNASGTSIRHRSLPAQSSLSRTEKTWRPAIGCRLPTDRRLRQAIFSMPGAPLDPEHRGVLCELATGAARIGGGAGIHWQVQRSPHRRGADGRHLATDRDDVKRALAMAARLGDGDTGIFLMICAPR